MVFKERNDLANRCREWIKDQQNNATAPLDIVHMVLVYLDVNGYLNEVVLCKDCKWQDKGKNECESWNMCRHNVIEYFAIYDEHFCEWGERREDD